MSCLTLANIGSLLHSANQALSFGKCSFSRKTSGHPKTRGSINSMKMAVGYQVISAWSLCCLEFLGGLK